MRFLKYVILAFSLIALALCLAYGVHSFGGQGWLTLGASALPGVLAALGILVWKGFPRWAGGVCLAAFLLVGMKTSGGNEELQNIMVAGFFGIFPSLALLIKPDRPRTR
jgi:hypothetical protein